MGNAIALTDPLGNKTTYSYDKIYCLTSQTDAENRTTNYNYDPVSNLLSLTDPEQNTTSYGYDTLNRMITNTNSNVEFLTVANINTKHEEHEKSLSICHL